MLSEPEKVAGDLFGTKGTMKAKEMVGSRDIPPYVAGGGCLFSIPVLLGVGFKLALGYAKSKEHQFAHQVEDVELEGEAALLAEESMTSKVALERLVKKLERVTEQFSKMGGRFSKDVFLAEKARLDRLRERVKSESSPDPACQNLIARAQQCLQQYAPQES